MILYHLIVVIKQDKYEDDKENKRKSPILPIKSIHNIPKYSIIGKSPGLKHKLTANNQNQNQNLVKNNKFKSQNSLIQFNGNNYQHTNQHQNQINNFNINLNIHSLAPQLQTNNQIIQIEKLEKIKSNNKLPFVLNKIGLKEERVQRK